MDPPRTTRRQAALGAPPSKASLEAWAAYALAASHGPVETCACDCDKGARNVETRATMLANGAAVAAVESGGTVEKVHRYKECTASAMYSV